MRVRDRKPASEPSASEGAIILSEGVQTCPTPISIELIPPGVSSSQVHPSGREVLSTLSVQVPASLPVDLTPNRESPSPPGSTLIGSVGISKVALYVGIIERVLTCLSLSNLV